MIKLLVLGIGNLLLTDDGVGVWAARKLMEEVWPEGVVIREAGTFTQDIFYTFGDVERLLVLDVVHAGGRPGSLYLLEEEALVGRVNQRLSIHDIDLLDSLRMAEHYFGRKPALRVLGMEPQNYTTWQIGLSPALEERFPSYLESARTEIARWLCEEPASLFVSPLNRG